LPHFPCDFCRNQKDRPFEDRIYAVCDARETLITRRGTGWEKAAEQIPDHKLCCSGSGRDGKHWIGWTDRHGREQLYAEGVGLFPGAYVDAGDVGRIAGAAPGSPGDYAIGAQANEIRRLTIVPPPPEPRVIASRRIRPPGAGPSGTDPIEYLGCFKENHGFKASQRDMMWGPQKKGYSQRTCAAACPDYDYMSLSDDGYCACDNSYNTPKKDFPQVPDKECDTKTLGQGTKGRASVYYLKGRFEDKKFGIGKVTHSFKTPCRDVRRRRRMYLPGLTGAGLDFDERCTKCSADFTEVHGFDWEGQFYTHEAHRNSKIGKTGKFNPEQCRNMCNQETSCVQAVFQCSLLSDKKTEGCKCKMYRTPGRKTVCATCMAYVSTVRSPDTAAPSPPAPAPPPLYPPLPPHCGGASDTSLSSTQAAQAAVTNAANEAAIAASAASAAQSAMLKTHPPIKKPFAAGAYAGDKEVVKYGHVVLNSEDELVGCHISTAQGRRILKVSLGRSAYAQLAEINFTFMKLTVCKATQCEIQSRILDCAIRWIDSHKTDNPLAPSLQYDPPTPCGQTALTAAEANI